MNRVDIELSRNRDFSVVVTILQEDDIYYQLLATEKLVFGVKLNPDEDSTIIYKEVTMADKIGNGYLLSLTAEELNVPPGHYHYDISLKSDTELMSVIDCSNFFVRESVVVI